MLHFFGGQVPQSSVGELILNLKDRFFLAGAGLDGLGK